MTPLLGQSRGEALKPAVRRVPVLLMAAGRAVAVWILAFAALADPGSSLGSRSALVCPVPGDNLVLTRRLVGARSGRGKRSTDGPIGADVRTGWDYR
jgi:hypothetical protein